ncbi:hypothetical protein QRD43_05035 [Pelomonas sp. APW6]|uniref:Uncharacterized protein n=1 Tax=Roseateles subflavus TaxID=3053353 RepID=A0ABT7LEI2_9BURK|nr:hypothetical protein [Pelomonas sp. APW6]MDL5031266.1 hypothetical protein [Pelomonas sp. APW6]
MSRHRANRRPPSQPTLVSQAKPAAQLRVKPDEIEDEMHRLLGRLIHGIARFDFIVGLQLRWIGVRLGVDTTKSLNVQKYRLADRLKCLQLHIEPLLSKQSPNALCEFQAWFDRAERARALRNDYAHGRWAAPGKYVESPQGPEHPRVPLLAFIPLDWDMSSGRPDTSRYMSLDELAEQVSDAADLFRSFKALSDKYLERIDPVGNE